MENLIGRINKQFDVVANAQIGTSIWDNFKIIVPEIILTSACINKEQAKELLTEALTDYTKDKSSFIFWRVYPYVREVVIGYTSPKRYVGSVRVYAE